MQEIFLQNPALPPPKIGSTEGKEVLSYSDHSLDRVGPKIGPLEATWTNWKQKFVHFRQRVFAPWAFLNLANMDLWSVPCLHISKKKRIILIVRQWKFYIKNPDIIMRGIICQNMACLLRDISSFKRGENPDRRRDGFSSHVNNDLPVSMWSNKFQFSTKL